MMDLFDFEDYLDGKILDRGFHYFEEGLVRELEPMGGGVFAAVVSGSEEYWLEVRLDEFTIADSRCDCPYDWGPVCKHQVALYYHLRENHEQLEGLSKQGGKWKKTLKDMKKADMQSYLEQVLSSDRLLRLDFEQRFGKGAASGAAPMTYKESPIPRKPSRFVKPLPPKQ